jgi:hypothetical protein
MTATTARLRSVQAGPTRRTVVRFLAAMGAMYLLGLGFLLEFEAGGIGVWAVLSDVGALLFGVSLVPLVSGIGFGPALRRLGLAAAGMVIAGSAWLVLAEALPGESNGWLGLAVQMAGLGTLGAWLVGVGRATLRTRRWSRLAGWAGLVAGSGYLVGTVAAALQAFTSPIFYASYAAAILGTATWAVRLVREETRP